MLQFVLLYTQSIVPGAQHVHAKSNSYKLLYNSYSICKKHIYAFIMTFILIGIDAKDNLWYEYK